jgi:2-polyprenyl-3-methyl-5-hydroxy-6-metoxy-1,4-benzoquinol methylase
MDMPGEARACPACRSPRITRLDPLPLRRPLDGCRYGFVSGCRACGLLFANPVRSREDFTAFYSTSGVWAEGQHDRQPSGDVVNAIRSRLAKAGLDVAVPPDQAAVLDIGCGDGGLLNGLQQLGWRTYGIEPAVKSAFVRHHELHEIPGQPMFHLIVLRHVLEHLPDPLDMLQKVQRALVADGCLFLSVPAVDTLPQHRDYRYCISDLPHVSAFTRACLAALLARAGLRMVPSDDSTSPAPSRARTEVVARNAPAAVPPARPLDAAVEALAGYRHAHRASVAERWLPVRLRAALLNTNWIALRVPLLSRLDESRAGARGFRLHAEDVRRTVRRRR